MKLGNIKNPFRKFKEKHKILKLENDAFSKSKRLKVLRSIYSQPITYCKLNEKTHLKLNLQNRQQCAITFQIQNSYNG